VVGLTIYQIMKNFERNDKMDALVEKTRQFHEKQKFPIAMRLVDCSITRTDDKLSDVATDLLYIAHDLEKLMKSNVHDTRLVRAQIMIEELGETIEALVQRDEISLLDGLSDLMFVTIGTALTFDMPIIAGLNEVCDSNLTKAPRSTLDARLRNKGADYKAPDMKTILEGAR